MSYYTERKKASDRVIELYDSGRTKDEIILAIQLETGFPKKFVNELWERLEGDIGRT